jgi:hypothetical protein
MVTFPTMIHGWVVRSDLTVEENKKETERAMEIALDYFKVHL